MRLSKAESGVTGSSGSAGESTVRDASWISRPPSFTRSSATTRPVTVTADSGVSAEIVSLSSLGCSSLPRISWARPVSSRSTTNCMRFWSRMACTHPRSSTLSCKCDLRSAIEVRATGTGNAIAAPPPPADRPPGRGPCHVGGLPFDPLSAPRAIRARSDGSGNRYRARPRRADHRQATRRGAR